MNPLFDVIVAKEYERNENGKREMKTAWNRVGRAWRSKAGDSINFELFLIPGLRYVIKLENKEPAQSFESENIPF